MQKNLLEGFQCFGRNERWGTCADCPHSDGKVFPEFCQYTDRYDHQLDAVSLILAYVRFKQGSR